MVHSTWEDVHVNQAVVASWLVFGLLWYCSIAWYSLIWLMSATTAVMVSVLYIDVLRSVSVGRVPVKAVHSRQEDVRMVS